MQALQGLELPCESKMRSHCVAGRSVVLALVHWSLNSLTVFAHFLAARFKKQADIAPCMIPVQSVLPLALTSDDGLACLIPCFLPRLLSLHFMFSFAGFVALFFLHDTATDLSHRIPHHHHHHHFVGAFAMKVRQPVSE